MPCDCDIESLRAMALSLPGTAEDLKWGQNLCFTVGGRIFLIMALDEVPPVITFKSDAEESSRLLEHNGVRKAAYLGRYQWLSVLSPEVFTPQQWEEIILSSYHRVASGLPLRMRRTLGTKSP